jgi:hypothetical protein
MNGERMNILFTHRPDLYLAGIVAAMFLTGLYLFGMELRQRSLERIRWNGATDHRK